MPTEYLWKPSDLKEKAIAELGTMDQGSYDHFMEKARQAASGKCPKYSLGISIQFKPGMGSDQAYPITRDEWGAFVSDARRMCVGMPKVYVFDPEKYSLPI